MHLTQVGTGDILPGDDRIIRVGHVTQHHIMVMEAMVMEAMATEAMATEAMVTEAMATEAMATVTEIMVMGTADGLDLHTTEPTITVEVISILQVVELAEEPHQAKAL